MKYHPPHYTIVNTQQNLLELINTANNSHHISKMPKPPNALSEIFCDTEFHREKTYYPQLCLIQLFINNKIYLIDTLSPSIDTSPLYDWMFKNNDKQLILHAFSQDVEVLEQESGYTIENVFDTQIAAAFSGYRRDISLVQLIEQCGGPALDKGPQVSNWARRPLSQSQLQYAAYDVAFLPMIYQTLTKKLHKQNRYEWFLHEMYDKITALKNSDTVHEIARKIHPKSSRNSRNPSNTTKRLEQLVAWREKLAQKQNLPRRWIVSDKSLSELASVNPKTPDDFKNLRFWNHSDSPKAKKNENIKRQEIISLLNCTPLIVYPAPVTNNPAHPNSSRTPKTHSHAQATKQEIASIKKLSQNPQGKNYPDEDEIRDFLKLLLKLTAKKSGLSAHLIASNNEMQDFLLDPETSEIIRDWKYEIFGKLATKALTGNVGLYIDQGKLTIYTPNTIPPQKNEKTKPTPKPVK